MDRHVTTFPNDAEFAKATGQLGALSLPYEVISPGPAFSAVAVPALIVSRETRSALWLDGGERFTCSGWVRYDPSALGVPQEQPPTFEEDLFGRTAVMVLARCVADGTKFRIIAHLSGDLAEVFPYWNAEMRRASFNPNGPTLTFMDGRRMISVYRRRIAAAKVDDIVDAWRVLEEIRRRVNGIWRRREHITPSYETRERPPALEIYKRLPGTNCGQCGEKTCLAFAASLWMGDGRLAGCRPVFAGSYANRKDALVEICAGLGVLDEEPALLGESRQGADTARRTS